MTESADFSPDRISLERNHAPIESSTQSRSTHAPARVLPPSSPSWSKSTGISSPEKILKQMLERLRIANLIDGRSVFLRLRILAKRRKLFFDFLHVKKMLDK